MKSGDLLRRARSMQGLSQRQLAAKVGAPQSVIARYESGRVEPSLEQLQRLLSRADMDLQVTIQPVRPRPHSLHDQRSLLYHRLVAERLKTEPGLLVRAQKRVQQWVSGRRPFPGSRQYVESWHQLLSQALPAIIAEITSEDDEAGELRHNSPFNGLLGQSVWQKIVDEVKEGASPTAG